MNDYSGGFGSFDRYGVDNKLDSLQNDNLERMKDDPFAFKAFLRDIKEAWERYWQYRDEFKRDVTALTNINSGWKEYSISLNTEYTVYGDDAKAVIIRMSSGKITPREDFVDSAIKVKNFVSSVKNFAAAKSLEDMIDIATFLDNAMDELIRDNLRMIESMLFEVQLATREAEKLLGDYGGFKFRYNVSLLGFSIEVSRPPLTGISPPISPPDNNTSSSNKTTTHDSVIPPYEPLPYTTYKVKPGDSFWRIASEQMGSGAKFEELARYNGLTSSSLIHPGNVLKIPR